MSSNSFLGYVYGSFDILCTTGYIVFLINFLSSKNKNYGSYYIIIFNVGFLFYSVLQTFKYEIVTSQLTADLFEVFVNLLFYFSMFWSCAFSIYTYNLLKDLSAYFNHRRFFIISIIVCLLLASLLPFMLTFNIAGLSIIWNEETRKFYFERPLLDFVNVFIFLFINDIISTLLPILTCSYFNFKVYKILSANNDINQQNFNPFRAYWSFAIPMICLMPSFLQDMYEALVNQELANIWATQVFILDRCWGLLTLAGFWFLKPVNNTEDLDDEDDDELPKKISVKVSMQSLSKRSLTSPLVTN